MSSEPVILHGFADHGVESSVLRDYGRVIRLTHDPRRHDHSEAVRADLSDPDDVPLEPGVADLALMHPPCTRWSDMPSADREAAPDLIDVAREIGDRYADEWIVENKPGAPLHRPTVLSGEMFGLPIEYERAFEASFRLRESPRRRRFLTVDGPSDTAETSPYYYSERSRRWWALAKGYDPAAAPKQHLAKNCLPARYVRWLVGEWLHATDRDWSRIDVEERTEQATLGRQVALTDGGDEDVE